MSHIDYTSTTKVTPTTFFQLLSMVFAISNASFDSDQEKPAILTKWNTFIAKNAKPPAFAGLVEHFGIKLKKNATESEQIQAIADTLQRIRDNLPGFTTTWEINSIRKTHALITMKMPEEDSEEEDFKQVTGKHAGTKRVTEQPEKGTISTRHRNSFEMRINILSITALPL